mmetsp:Transcript_22912/g.33227  ORF Transcript_22912/g.33227 Transcript_22912/m.33227 type:complete len:90 (+) Transcript_22912:215-484(+)
MGNSPTKMLGRDARKIISKKVDDQYLHPHEATRSTDIALFASGCFWSVELTFQRVPGVIKTRVGYTGSPYENPVILWLVSIINVLSTQA